MGSGLAAGGGAIVGLASVPLSPIYFGTAPFGMTLDDVNRGMLSWIGLGDEYSAWINNSNFVAGRWGGTAAVLVYSANQLIRNFPGVIRVTQAVTPWGQIFNFVVVFAGAASRLATGAVTLSSGLLIAASSASGRGPRPNNQSIGRIDPHEVRFSQNSISYRFRDGSSIDDLAEGLRTGKVGPEDVPPIRLVEKDGIIYTLDNRRLQAFRRANVPIRYRMATAGEGFAEWWKFTTRNQGTSIVVRGGP